jgi:hypothetical protein
MAEATAKMAEVASMLVDSRFFCVKLGKRVKKKVRKTNNAILPTNSANQKLGVYRLCNLATLRLGNLTFVRVTGQSGTVAFP